MQAGKHCRPYSNKRYLVVFDEYRGDYGNMFSVLGLYFTTVDADEAISRVVEDAHVDRKIFRVIELEEGKTYQTSYSKSFETYDTDKCIGGYIVRKGPYL